MSIDIDDPNVDPKELYDEFIVWIGESAILKTLGNIFTSNHLYNWLIVKFHARYNIEDIHKLLKCWQDVGLIIKIDSSELFGIGFGIDEEFFAPAERRPFEG